MAHNAPTSNYRRRYYIASHAIERLRGRIQERKDIQYRDDDDLGNMIDVAVSEAALADKREQFLEKGVLSMLIDVREHLNEPLFALVRENDRQGAGVPPYAVVTLLTDDMVTESKADGRWIMVAPQAAPVAVVAETRTLAIPRLVETKIIRYRQEGKPYFVEYPAHEIAERVAELVLDPKVSAASIEVFQKQTFKLRVEFGE